MELGVLKTVSARQRWLDEARDFTPWLAEHISELGKAVGLELEVERVEVQCGPYSADILAKDTGTDDYVVIENQLEKTDHDHLGKALTYASVLDASTVIWIATQFTPEHKKALDWLNDNTAEQISFYGVQLELWQIDDSSPAIKFNIISKPNQAVIQASRSKAKDDLSENRQFQLEFWTKFRDKLAKTKKIPSLQSPRAQYWFNVSLGKTHIHLSNTCNTDESTVGLRVYISNKIAATMLPHLEGKKAEIEAAIGQTLQWNPNPENIDKVIVLQKATDFTDPKSQEEALDWLVEYTIKFREIFSKVIVQQG
jgi:Domain of unknown function (DUF4268)